MIRSIAFILLVYDNGYQDRILVLYVNEWLELEDRDDHEQDIMIMDGMIGENRYSVVVMDIGYM